jgi:glutaredoxin-like YruB-family protein
MTIDSEASEAHLLSADVNNVRDIHIKFGISSVPSLLLFENGELVNVIKGCHSNEYYRSLIANTLFRAETGSDQKPVKRVTVYSTPTCSWCNTLKAWLNRNNIPYSDIDVSRDEKAAREMVRRSGQQGVPQTDINGQVVIGFNQQKLKELLGIH